MIFKNNEQFIFIKDLELIWQNEPLKEDDPKKLLKTLKSKSFLSIQIYLYNHL